MVNFSSAVKKNIEKKYIRYIRLSKTGVKKISVFDNCRKMAPVFINLN